MGRRSDQILGVSGTEFKIGKNEKKVYFLKESYIIIHLTYMTKNLFGDGKCSIFIYVLVRKLCC
jgi:hypothetical protein